MGQSSRFREYQQWANGTLYAPYRSVPVSRWREACKELVTAGIALVLMTSLSAYYARERRLHAVGTGGQRRRLCDAARDVDALQERLCAAHRAQSQLEGAA